MQIEEDQQQSQLKIPKHIQTTVSKRGVPNFQGTSRLINLRPAQPSMFGEIQPNQAKNQRPIVDIRLNKRIIKEVEEIIHHSFHTLSPNFRDKDTTQLIIDTHSSVKNETKMGANAQSPYADSNKIEEISSPSINNEFLTSRKILHFNYQNIPYKSIGSNQDNQIQGQKITKFCKAHRNSLQKSIDSGNNLSPKFQKNSAIEYGSYNNQKLKTAQTIKLPIDKQVSKRKSNQEISRPHSSTTKIHETLQTLHNPQIQTYETSSNNLPFFCQTMTLQPTKIESSSIRNKINKKSLSKHDVSASQGSSTNSRRQFKKQTKVTNKKIKIVMKQNDDLINIETHTTEQINDSNSEVSNLSEPNLSQGTLKTEVDLDEDGNELIEARDFGIGTENIEDFENQDHLDNLRELDRIGLMYNLRTFPNELQPHYQVRESYNVRRAAIKQFYKEYTKEMKLRVSKLQKLSTRGQRIIYKSIDGTQQIINPDQAEVLSPHALAQMTLSGRHLDNVKPIGNFNPLAHQQSYTLNYEGQQIKFKLVPNFVQNPSKNDQLENNSKMLQKSVQKTKESSQTVKKPRISNTSQSKVNYKPELKKQQSTLRMNETLKRRSHMSSILSYSQEDVVTIYEPFNNQKAQIENDKSRTTQNSPLQNELPQRVINNNKKQDRSGNPKKKLTERNLFDTGLDRPQVTKKNSQQYNTIRPNLINHLELHHLEDSCSSVKTTPPLEQPIQITKKKDKDFIKSLELTKHPITNFDQSENRSGHPVARIREFNNEQTALKMAKGSTLFSKVSNQLSNVFNPFGNSAKSNNQLPQTLGNRHWINSQRNTLNMDKNDVVMHTKEQGIKVRTRQVNTLRQSSPTNQFLTFEQRQGHTSQRSQRQRNQSSFMGLQEKPDYPQMNVLYSPQQTIQHDEKKWYSQQKSCESSQIQTVQMSQISNNVQQNIQNNSKLNFNIKRVQNRLIEQSHRAEKYHSHVKILF